jgi:hypothetical protein
MGYPTPSFPESTVKITHVEPCGEGKVCITIEMVVDAHHLVEVSGRMLSVAARGAAKRKQLPNP